MRVITHVFGTHYEEAVQAVEAAGGYDSSQDDPPCPDDPESRVLHNVMVIGQYPVISEDKLAVLRELHHGGQGQRNRLQQLPQECFDLVTSFVGGNYRRLDIKSCERHTLPYMLTYFTGRCVESAVRRVDPTLPLALTLLDDGWLPLCCAVTTSTGA